MKMCLSVYIKVCFVKVSTFHTCYPPPLSSSSSSSRRHSCKWEFSHSCRDTQKRSHRRPTRFLLSIHSPVVLVFFGDGQTSANVAPFKKKEENPFVFFFRFFLFDDLRLYTAVIFLNFVPTAHDVATFSFYLFNLIYWIEIYWITWTRDSVSPMRIAISSRMKMSG